MPMTLPEEDVDPLLPDRCYAQHPVDGKLILIKRGYRGYFQLPHTIRETAAELNASLGVTEEAAECMLVGSAFGWNVPGARLAATLAKSFRPRLTKLIEAAHAIKE